MSKTKSFILRAFSVTSSNTLTASNALELLNKSLPDASIAENRVMPLSNEENSDKDFLADFEKKKNLIFGLMMRIATAKDVPEIDPDLFKQPKITVSDLKTNDKSSSLCKDSYYFALANDFLVTTLNPRTTIKRFQTYINWLLEEQRDGQFFSFSPVVDLDKKTLSSVNKIIYSDPETPGNSACQKEMSGLKIYDITIAILKRICGADANLQDLIDKDIVKAELLVKFKKPKKISEEEYAKALSATLKPVSDLENVKITTKDGAQIKGDQLFKIKRVEIELQSDNDQINQQQLGQEIEKFILELRSSNGDS